MPKALRANFVHSKRNSHSQTAAAMETTPTTSTNTYSVIPNRI
ncbi:hypothetical protein ACFSZS_29030 [Seohaeicola zhoushanensis]